MKNILVATDFSNDAYCALFYVSKLMTSRPCTFYILNVYDSVTPLDGKKTWLFAGKKLLEQLGIRSNEKLRETYHKIVLDNIAPHHQYQTISRKGTLPKIIGQLIDSHQIDLVVMGSKGATGAKELFMGSNTIQVANALYKCPILVVPKQSDFRPPKAMAFVTDLKKGCAQESIAPLSFLASMLQVSLHVVHIQEEEILTPEQENHRKLLVSCFNTIDHHFHWVQNFADKAKVIDQTLEKLSIDLFAMVHYKRSLVTKLIMEPVINDVCLYTDIPFLILPHHE